MKYSLKDIKDKLMIKKLRLPSLFFRFKRNRVVDPPTEGIYVLINPSRYPQLAKLLKELLKTLPIKTIMTSRDEEHFVECVEDFYRSSKKYLFIWGGDGSINLAINTAYPLHSQLEDKTSKRLGFFRGGSGNGYQDSYLVPRPITAQIHHAMRLYSEDSYLLVSLLRVTFSGKTLYGQLFGTGYDAEVLKGRDRVKRNFGPHKGGVLPGVLSYLYQGFRYGFALSFGKSSLPVLQITLRTGRQVAVGNTSSNPPLSTAPFQEKILTLSPTMFVVGLRPYFAAKFAICPNTSPTSRTLPVYLYQYRNPPIFEIPCLSTIWKGKLEKLNKWAEKRRRRRRSSHPKPLPVSLYEAEEIVISSTQPILFHIDGELQTVDVKRDDRYELTLQLVPKGLAIACRL